MDIPDFNSRVENLLELFPCENPLFTHLSRLSFYGRYSDYWDRNPENGDGGNQRGKERDYSLSMEGGGFTGALQFIAIDRRSDFSFPIYLVGESRCYPI
jgi:hypothetical protein